MRTYNGGEYTEDEFLAFDKQKGIKRQFMVVYTPQQNGVTEQMNRTLIERITNFVEDCWSTQLILSKSSQKCPSIAIELKTSMEMWTGEPTNYFYLHLFGCHVYVIYNAQE